MNDKLESALQEQTPQQPLNGSHPSSDDLDGLRANVDRIDNEILELLAQRRLVAEKIAAEKHLSGRPFYDEQREQSLLSERLAGADARRLDQSLVLGVWQHILADSVRVQHEYAQGELNHNRKPPSVAIQGIVGSYSHLAARRLLGDIEGISLVSCGRFGDAFDAVLENRASLAVLPIENTTSGGIAEVYDLLLQSRLFVVGEAKLRIEHCLLGMPGASMEGLRRVYGHPQAVAQCSDFLSGLADVEVVYFGDTASSGRRIAELGDPSVAAIAGEEAAALFGLEVLKKGVGNRESNYTRFIAIARGPIDVDPRIPAKTSLVMSVSNQAGSLSEVLAEFRDEGISLVKLESRPTVNKPWEEMFYVDVDGNISEERLRRALDGVRRRARFLRVLGTYPSRDLRPSTRPKEPLPATKVTERAPAPTEVDATLQAAPSHLASRSHKAEDTTIVVDGVVLGGPDMVMIAGPCAVESQEQVMACAKVVKAAGATLLRGGCFKPRTSPYSFQGLGYEGLEMLAEAGRVYGLPIVTEVPAPEFVGPMAEVADILQIGARNMQNFALLAAVGRTNRPVVLKRGMSASIEELLLAAEYILSGGNQQVILCERGIRTFETSSRSTLDVTAVPVLRMKTHLPVIVDPSHAAGDRRLVAPLAMAAAAAGAQGIMVEIHPDPATALSDGPQALRFDDFERLMESLGKKAPS